MKFILRRVSEGGIGLVEMLYRCNIVALVGGGKSPRYPPNRIMIWDDHQNRCIGDLCFRSEVKAVKLRRDRLIAVMETKINIYNLEDLKIIGTHDTFGNPRGLCAVSHQESSFVLVYPDRSRGVLRAMNYSTMTGVNFTAAKSAVACITLNSDGSMCATASDKGTLIRIWNTSEGTLM